MTTQIIDNFLPINLFKEIQKEVVYNEDFLWRHIYSLNDSQTNNLDTYFVHLVYEDNEPITTFWNIVKPIISYLPDFKSLLRIKVNLYVRQNKIVEHTPHTDDDYPHKGAILSLNTCDGFTRLKNQTVDSVENRLLIFDASRTHNSTSTTTPPGRFNININYV